MGRLIPGNFGGGEDNRHVFNSPDNQDNLDNLIPLPSTEPSAGPSVEGLMDSHLGSMEKFCELATPGEIMNVAVIITAFVNKGPNFIARSSDVEDARRRAGLVMKAAAMADALFERMSPEQQRTVRRQVKEREAENKEDI